MCNSVIFSEKEEKKNVNLTGNKNIFSPCYYWRKSRIRPLKL